MMMIIINIMMMKVMITMMILVVVVVVVRKDGNVLFNDTLNTFYLVIGYQAYGKGPLATWATLSD